METKQYRVEHDSKEMTLIRFQELIRNHPAYSSQEVQITAIFHTL